MSRSNPPTRTVALFANTDWYLFNFRQSLAAALVEDGFDVLLLSPPGPYSARFADRGLRWKAVPLRRRSLSPVDATVFVHRLSTVLVEEKVELLHSFTVKCAVLGSLAARWASWRGWRVAKINSITGLGYVFTSATLKAKLLRRVLTWIMQRLFCDADTRLIVQNRDDLAWLFQTRFGSRLTLRLILGSGVDCVRFRPRKIPRDDQVFRVLTASRVLWAKGMRELVDSARRVQAQDRSVQFLLAGQPDPGSPDTVPLSVLQKWVERGWLVWLGHIDDMPSLLRNVDLVVFPSHREGCPRALLEAAACGLPIVTTDVPGCREVVTNGVDGVLVPAGEPIALANAVVALRQDSVLCARLGQAARDKALSLFEERYINEQSLSVYRELLPRD